MDPNPGPFFYPPSSAANIVIKIRFIDKIMPLALSRVEIVNRLLKSSKILFTIERICIHQGTAKDQVACMTDHTIGRAELRRVRTVIPEHDLAHLDKSEPVCFQRLDQEDRKSTV